MVPTKPNNISAFEMFLTKEGLNCLRDESPENSMGYRLIEYAAGNIGVRLELDRGFWEVKIADVAKKPDDWYQVNLFTYLFPGQREPKMSIADQLEFAVAHWPQLVTSFSPAQQGLTHARLHSARKERIRAILPVWPDLVLELEEFMKEKGLACTIRKEPKDIYGARMLQYSDANLGVRISMQDEWRIEFGDMTTEPIRWYSFRSIRRLIQWPIDRKLSFPETFEFIKVNWSEIVRRFDSLDGLETHARLNQLEEEMPEG
jgi:hypothetical protein